MRFRELERSVQRDLGSLMVWLIYRARRSGVVDHYAPLRLEPATPSTENPQHRGPSAAAATEHEQQRQ